MRMIAAQIASKIDLDLDANTSSAILSSACVSCKHGVSKLFLADTSCHVKAFTVTDGSVIQKAEWELHAPAEQLCIWTDMGCGTILARTRSGSVWQIRCACLPQEHPTKRTRIQDCEQIYEDRNLIWIQPQGAGFYGLLNNGTLVHYEEGVQQQEIRTGLNLAHPAVTASTLVDPAKLSDSFLGHLGLPKEHPTMLLGYENGDIRGVSLHGQEVQLANMPEETVSAIYCLRLNDSTFYDAVIVLGRCGTIQLFIEAQNNCLIFKEFFIPAPLLFSCTLLECSLLVSLKGEVHLVEIVNCGKNQTLEKIELKTTRLNTLQGVIHLYHTKQDSSEHELMLVTDNSQVIQAWCDIGSTIDVENNPALLQQAISGILTELSDHEKAKNDMDANTKRLNEKLVTINRIIYALQRIKAQKAKLQIENDDDASPFQCDIQPITVPNSMRRFASSTTCLLRIRIRTMIPLDWEHWNLHVNLSHQRTLLQQVTASCMEQDSIDGKTFTVPLVGVSEDQIWEQDIPIDLGHLRLPLAVSMQLSTHLDLSSQTDEAHEPLDADEHLWKEIPKSFIFPLSDLELDDLHFISPCTDTVSKLLKKSGVRGATARTLTLQSNRKLVDNCGQYPLARLEDPCCIQTLEHYETASLRFRVEASNGISVEESCDHFLRSLLQEARTREELDKIMDTPDRAVFTLAAYPEYPVILQLEKESQAQLVCVAITIHCQSPVVLLKVETALLVRSREFMVDRADTGALADQAQLAFMNAATDLEEGFRSGCPPEFWDALKDTMAQLRKLYNNSIVGSISL